MLKPPKINPIEKIILTFSYPVFAFIVYMMIVPNPLIIIGGCLCIFMISYKCLLRLSKPHTGYNIFDTVLIFLIPSLLLLIVGYNFFYPIG